MKSKINEGIKALEAEKGIKILLACEIGPIALGIPLESETQPVGFIYMHPKDWYISLDEKKDQISLKKPDSSISFHGWDLRKALNLLHRSNMPLIERIQSKTFYAMPEFKIELEKMVPDFYSPISVMYHHLSLVKKQVESFSKTDQISYENACYMIRSALICCWILNDNQIPPLSLNELLNGLKIDPTTKAHITRYIRTKKTFSKTELLPVNAAIIAFLNLTLGQSETYINQLSGAQNKTHDLNALFVKWLNQKELFFSREVD